MIYRKTVTQCAALVLSGGAAIATMAEPTVQGPESVADWYNAGTQFIKDTRALDNTDRRAHAKNVILFVGDGMGISTITAARILEGQMKGKTGEENRLSFEGFPYLGLSKTYSWDQQTSDSAPTMTAMSTGYKAREGMLSVNQLTARGECNAATVSANSLQTILELAAAKGKSTGVVSTARLTHATPAALYAHTPVRDWEADVNLSPGCGVKDIARQLIEVSPAVKASLKVAMGGGRYNFLRNTDADPEYPTTKGKRADGRDLTAEWVTTRGANASYVWNKAGFDSIDPNTTDYLLGLFELSHMQYEADRALDTGGEPSLTEMTEKSIKMLQKNPKGYFLHVEGGRVDHAHHAGNAKRALIEAIELSNAVRKAIELTSETDTTIIVTADHSHVFTIAGYPHRGNNILGLVSDVPLIDGDPTTITKASDGLPYTTLGYQNGPGYRGTNPRPDLTTVDTTAVDFLQEAAIPLSAETHAGEDVAIFARGPKAFMVRGSMEQNWIYHVMRDAFGFGLGAPAGK